MSTLCKAMVVSQREVASRHFLLELEAEPIAQRARPGQFVHVRCSDSFDPLLRRPFSLHRILPQEGRIVILYRQVGRGTAWLASRRPGDSVEIMGPLGNGFELGLDDSGGGNDVVNDTASGEANSKTNCTTNCTTPQTNSADNRFSLALLVGGGVGAAPLLALAEALRAQGRRVVVFIGASSREQLLQVEAFSSVGAEVVTATDDGSEGYRGTVVAALEDWVEKMLEIKVKERLKKQEAERAEETGTPQEGVWIEKANETASKEKTYNTRETRIEVFACGPKAMLLSLQRLCAAKKFPLQVSLEERMGCGVGACLSCVCRLAGRTEPQYARVCVEGPVFKGEEVCLDE